jgi:predicted transcriptional regulator
VSKNEVIKISARALLTPRQVRMIRERRKQGHTQTRLAKDFGVSQSAIAMLLSGKTYRKVA